LLKQKFGEPSDDANKLIEYCEKESAEDKCKFYYSLNELQQLDKFLYGSFDMVNIPDVYYDVLIVDSTLGKNVFNMPLVNFVCIDDEGKSRIIAFGLIGCEEEDYYRWLFKKIFLIHKIMPKLIFTDEDPAIINGNFFVFPPTLLKI